MAREPITKHGSDHRLPGTNGASDPGGHDQIPGLLPGAPADASYTTTPQTGATGATKTMAWSHVTGSTLFDLSTPTLPVPLADGVYAVMVNFAGGAGAGTWTVGSELEAHLYSSRLSGAIECWETAITSDLARVPEGSATLVTILEAGDNLQLDLFNRDAAGSRSVQTTSIAVTLIRAI